MKKFSESAWESISSIYDAIVEHPFNQQLMDGSLHCTKFAYYIEQDALYLEGYARSNAVIASKVPKEYFVEFLQHAKSAYLSEHELVHDFFVEKFGIQQTSDTAPATIAYVAYLLSTVFSAAIEVAVAAMLPCLWIYRELGKYMAEHAESSNPYYNWITAYSDEKFSQSVDSMISIVDTLAEGTTVANQLLMQEAFYVSSVYEWHFWDDAYNTRVFGDIVI